MINMNSTIAIDSIVNRSHSLCHTAKQHCITQTIYLLTLYFYL